MPKFSIIIPIYNAADRIHKVLDSVFSQTIDDYELILVCDSCTDKTVDIIKKYYLYPDEVPSRKNFIKESEAGNVTKYNRDNTSVIISEVEFHNDGLTRSKGLDLATGNWVMFLDDDDWWLGDDILEVVNKVVSAYPQKDIFQFGFIWKGKGYCSCHIEDSLDVKREATKKLYANVWSKCFKRSFIGDVRFPEVHSVSDGEFMKKLMEKPSDVAFCEYPIYYYNWLRKGSISEQDRKQKIVMEDVGKMNWNM